MSINYTINKDSIIRGTVMFTIVGYVIITYPGYEPFTTIAASLMTWMLSLYFESWSYGNHMVFTDSGKYYGFITSPECSGVLVMLVFLFVVFMTPNIKLKHRFYSIAFLPILFILNSIRVLFGIMLADLTTMSNLSFYHATIGQVFMFVSMIVIYVMFLRMFGYFKKDKDREYIDRDINEI